MKYNVAFGKEICMHLLNENYEGVAMCIGYNDGDIIGWDSENDLIEELLEYAVNSEDYCVVSNDDLEIINELL